MANSRMTLDDGIIHWFDGPEWDDVVLQVFKDHESDLENRARSNAEWQDQTGAARAGLTATAVNEDGLVTLTLYHTVDHGQWLETIQNGRFAVIMRTLEEAYSEIAREATEAVKEARRGK